MKQISLLFTLILFACTKNKDALPTLQSAATATTVVTLDPVKPILKEIVVLPAQLPASIINIWSSLLDRNNWSVASLKKDSLNISPDISLYWTKNLYNSSLLLAFYNRQTGKAFRVFETLLPVRDGGTRKVWSSHPGGNGSIYYQVHTWPDNHVTTSVGDTMPFDMLGMYRYFVPSDIDVFLTYNCGRNGGTIKSCITCMKRGCSDNFGCDLACNYLPCTTAWIGACVIMLHPPNWNPGIPVTNHLPYDPNSPWAPKPRLPIDTAKYNFLIDTL